MQGKANAEKKSDFKLWKNVEKPKKRKEATGETISGQKKKTARPSGSDTLDFMRKKLETDTKIKQGKFTLRRSEQKKSVDQQNNILQHMQVQQVNQ